MKILELKLNQGEIKTADIWEEQLDSNEYYSVRVLYFRNGARTGICGSQNIVQTFYVLSGEIETTVYGGNPGEEIGKKIFVKDGGWSLLPGQAQKLEAKQDCAVFTISAKAVMNQLSDLSGKNPIRADKLNELTNYIVTKPWGSEQWLVQNGIYVLKGITMTAGSSCSLQLHEKKMEMNLILKGRATLTLAYDEEIEKEVVLHKKSGKDQASFSVDEGRIARIKGKMQATTIGPEEGWTIKPFQIHQVLSKDTYFALEVSTIHVDDVIRLKDLYNRPGGRIESEHQQNKQ